MRKRKRGNHGYMPIIELDNLLSKMITQRHNSTEDYYMRFTNVIDSIPASNIQLEFKTRWTGETLKGYYDDKIISFISGEEIFNCFLDVYEWRYI